MKLLKSACLIGLTFVITACTATFRSDVATFHEITAPGGERVMLVPMNPDKKDSLEFRQYATDISSHLLSYGYKEAGDAEPELIAGFDITISEGREKLRNRPSPYPFWRSRWTWGGYWGHHFGYHDPFSDPYSNNTIVAGTVYTATLTLELRTPEGELKFEGRVETETRKKSLPEVVPFLAKALFQSFPGESGVTRRVIIEKHSDVASAS
ncbi:MAG: DUF4136 domain-containing protein [Kordiimonadaceae bacterium]|nr:DUF4136 domain-containing protein [Kordiimonadaceae bacterium]